MKTVAILLYYDWLETKSWFKQQTVSKIIVFLIFTGLFLILSFFLFFLSQGFFKNLTFYKDYGFLTAKYILNASIVLIGWFAIISGSVSIYEFLQKSNKKIEYLLTQPIPSFVLIFWIFIKSLMVNGILLFLFFSPIVFAFNEVFFNHISLNFLIRFCLIILFFNLLTNDLASLFGFIFAHLIKKDRVYIMSVGGLVVFFITFFSLIYLIFPKELFLLENAPLEKFHSVYTNLPLLNQWFPSSWIIKTLLEGFSLDFFYLLVLTLMVTGLIFFLQKQRFIFLFQSLILPPPSKTISTKQEPLLRFPLIFKDWFSITRNSSEINYSLFLFSIVIFFYFFLSRILIFKKIEDSLQDKLVIFSFVWLIFFTAAFFLRLVYPLMAKEGPVSWYIFTLPVPKTKILFNKLILGFFLCLPLLLFSFILWYLLPFKKIDRFFITLVSSITIFILSFINVFMGSILPNFHQGNDPEAVSTSGMGIATVIMTIFITITVSRLLYRTLENKLSHQVIFLFLITFAFTFYLFLFSLAKKFLKKYQF